MQKTCLFRERNPVSGVYHNVNPLTTKQNENNIVVQYPDAIVKMTLGNVFKTFNRPIFENDDEVWNTFAQYASVRNDLEKQQKNRNSLSKELEVLESGELPG